MLRRSASRLDARTVQTGVDMTAVHIAIVIYIVCVVVFVTLWGTCAVVMSGRKAEEKRKQYGDDYE